jgi:predicted ATPase
MPAFLTSFVGRQQEVAAISALLSRPDVHLLTLWGTGGIGKTRLAIEAAGTMRTSFADGVCFVGLAPIRDPDLVMPTIARALSIQKTAERSLIEQMQARLREKHLLLVLDNLEQVIAFVPAVEELLLACPYVKVLTTSREVLRLQGERLYRVPPFTLPNLNELPEYEVLVRMQQSLSFNNAPEPSCLLSTLPQRMCEPLQRSACVWMDCRWPLNWRRHAFVCCRQRPS